MRNATPDSRTSIAAVVDDAAGRLERAGVRSGRPEARALWAALAGTSSGDVWLRRENSADGQRVAAFQEAVERRAGGMPFAYAAGRVTFRTLDLRIDGRALIPRPETEGLVELVLRWASDAHRSGGVVADIGTGSGCIALSLAVEGTFERVVAVDASAPACSLARENVAMVRPRVPVEVREGNLLAALDGGRYRAIVANPPYLTEDEYGALDPAVREYEPRAALVSGPDGLDATRQLFDGAPSLLEPGGLLALEIDERRSAQVLALADRSRWSRVDVLEDLFGRPRYALATAREESIA